MVARATTTDGAVVRSLVFVLLAFIAAGCTGGPARRDRSNLPGAGTNPPVQPSRDAGDLASAPDAATMSDLDMGTSDRGQVGSDAEPADAGESERDLGASLDAAGPRDAGTPDLGPPEPPAAELRLQAQGCAPDFGGDLVVSSNGSLAVGSLRGSRLVTSLQFALPRSGAIGTHRISTDARVNTGLVVNLVLQATLTNIAQDPQVISGQRPDPISGTLIVRAWDPQRGVADIELLGVTLQHVVDQSLCTLTGSVRTTRIGR